MNINGKQFIDGLVERLKDTKRIPTDNNIVQLLSTLDNYELNQLVTFGTVDKWMREKQPKIE
jgi:hypothetical protein